MNRNLYFSGIFLAALSCIITFFQSYIYFKLGRQLYTQESFLIWYLILSLISLAGTLILLKYLHYKKFTFAFRTGSVSLIAAVLHFAVAYSLRMIGMELLNLYVPIVLLFSATSIAYSAGLTFSSTRKRLWLRTAGIFGLVLSIGTVSVILWNMTPTPESSTMAEKTYPWISLAGAIAPLLYMMNFISELKSLGKETAKSSPSATRPMNALSVVGCAIAFSSVLVAGRNLWTESYWAMDWKSKQAERAQRLAGPFEAHKFLTASGDTVRYRLLKPFDYDSAKAYPLVVCLHHGGTHGTDNVRQIDGAGAAQLLYERRTEYPAFLFVPQCPQGTSWGGLSGYPTVDSLIFESIAALEHEFMIDTTRRYIIGSSGGGYGTWHFISRRPDMFAAAVPICGGGDPGDASKLTTTSIWAFHGEKDRSVPVNLSRNMIEAIKRVGGDPRYTEFAGAGHNIWVLVKETPDLLPWMFGQRKTKILENHIQKR